MGMKLPILFVSAFFNLGAFLALAIPSSRNLFVEKNIIGEYVINSNQASTCSKSVGINEITKLGGGAYGVPHSAITELGYPCRSNGTLLIFPHSERNRLENDSIQKTTSVASIIDILTANEVDFQLGVEQVDRLCGVITTRASTIVIFMQTDMAVDIKDIMNFSAGSKMLVYLPGSATPCIYSIVKEDAMTGMPSTSVKPVVDTEMDSPIQGAPPVAPPPKKPTDVVAEQPLPSNPSDMQVEPSTSVAPVTDFPTATAAPIITPMQPNDGSDAEGGEDDEEAASTAESGAACFPADARVTLEDGSTKRMSDLEIGDSVKVGSQQYSPVFMFTHRDSSSKFPFVRLVTSRLHSLFLTPGHYLYVNGTLAIASSVRPGDVVIAGNGTDTVLFLDRILKTGLYNPQTLHGDIVVNDIKASTYTVSVEQKMAHALLTPLRTLFKWTGFSANVFDSEAHRAVKFMPSRHILI